MLTFRISDATICDSRRCGGQRRSQRVIVGQSCRQNSDVSTRPPLHRRRRGEDEKVVVVIFIVVVVGEDKDAQNADDVFHVCIGLVVVVVVDAKKSCDKIDGKDSAFQVQSSVETELDANESMTSSLLDHFS